MAKRRAQGVIGGMFGDEGKGLMTDALASRMMREHGQCTVVRFNGGAQAGHTVQMPDGRRHVFHHLGSGSLAGASTHLSRRFVAHPMLFLAERMAVAQLGGNVQASIDPQCIITTPYDVMVNQAVEHARGTGRHGSCGVGFGEAIERTLHPQFSLFASELDDRVKVARVLDDIRQHYLPARLAALGLPGGALDAWRMEDAIIERFVDDASLFFDMVPCLPIKMATQGGVLFEGAQGLGLDEDLGAFPYVTRSKTGLPYLVEACQEAGIAAVDVHYGTRAYTTRHGAGPMEFEDGITPPHFSDATNQPNDFQGSLRFSPLQASKFAQLVRADMARVDPGPVSLRFGGYVSCLDQMGENTPIAGANEVPTRQLASYLKNRIGFEWMSQSHGPTREHVQLRCVDGADALREPGVFVPQAWPLPLADPAF